MSKKSGFTSAEIEEIKRLYLQEGRSILQIPKILGKGSENSVRNALHNNETLAAALHAGNSGQPLQQWIQWNHPDRLTFRLRKRGWCLRTA